MRIYVALQKRRLILSFIGILVACLAVALHLTHASPLPEISPTVSSKSQPLGYVSPTRIQIPAISVNAPIDHVGLTSKGALAAPKEPGSAGWFALGPRPGELGNAVIDGHFGFINKIPAVFDNLSKLKPGDSLSVQDQAGVNVAFVVRQIRSYGQNQDDSDVFNSSDGKAHLNLITCEGVWSAVEHSFSSRLVVFTDKAP